jgi:hypothetical protein
MVDLAAAFTGGRDAVRHPSGTHPGPQLFLLASPADLAHLDVSHPFRDPC